MDTNFTTPASEGCPSNGICATEPGKDINYETIYVAVTLGALSITVLAAVGIGYYCYKRWFKPVNPPIGLTMSARAIEANNTDNMERIRRAVDIAKQITDTKTKLTEEKLCQNLTSQDCMSDKIVPPHLVFQHQTQTN